jgi:cardiolipin synthase
LTTESPLRYRLGVRWRELLYLPNLLTLERIVLVPIFLYYLATGRARVAFWIFIAASVTDVLDGLVARLMRLQTSLGGWLDPLADKLLVASAFITLTVLGEGRFPVWFTVLVLGRDAVIALGIGVLWLTGRRFQIEPTRLSKYATFLQLVTLAAALLYLAADRPATALPYLRAIMALCAVMVSISVSQYVWRGTKIVGAAS